MPAEQHSRDTILDFWFGPPDTDAAIAARQARLWWAKDDQTDATITERFGATIDLAARGALDHWADTPRGSLALVLLTDQFPRNAFRGTPRAFASDAIARRWCAECLAAGTDLALRPIERVFVYLPLEHSESIADQDRAVACFEALARDAAPEFAAQAKDYLDYAIRHREIIARFGRFPHRNAILGRASTAAERAFLEQPGSSF